jgi:two-component system OmpR family response regulator
LSSGEHTTILIAEDDTALRALLKAILTREGYRVLEAADGIRTVRLLAEEHVDALLMDVRLGADDGIALGHELRLDRPHLPIALMSGDSSAAEARERAVGLTDVFLEKPFTLPAVSATVETLLKS